MVGNQRQLKIELALLTVTVVAGTIGTYQYLTSVPAYDPDQSLKLLFEAVLTGIGFLILNSGPYPATGGRPLTLGLIIGARVTGVVFFSYSAYLGFKALFADRLKPLRIRLWNSTDWLGDNRPHIVVAGLEEKGQALTEELLGEGYDVVAIDPDCSETQKRRLSNEGAVVFTEDATREQTLIDRAQADRAGEIYVNCSDDRTNAAVVDALADGLPNETEGTASKPSLTCYAHLSTKTWREFVHGQLTDETGLHLQTYDTSMATARELLQRRFVDRHPLEQQSGRTHVTIVGCNDLSRALVYQLCQLLHYLPDQGRQITVAAADPQAAKADLYERYPALNPQRWDNPQTKQHIEAVFPDISFIALPENLELLLSDRFELFDQLHPDDAHTMFVTAHEDYPAGAIVETLLPRLKTLHDQQGLETQVHYFTPSREGELDPTRALDISTTAIPIEPFDEFVDTISPASVKGRTRDAMAKQLGLFFHLRYDYDPTADTLDRPDSYLKEHLPLSPPNGTGYDYETAVSLWENHTLDEILDLAEPVWHQLPETHRESNRHAADHALVKRRLAETSKDETELVAQLSEVEHQRWCAAAYLDGWEPLPESEIEAWKHEPGMEDRFREQRYHLDLRPMDELRRLTDGEAEKDTALVRFALEHLKTPHRGS